jgi:hypothetical protein
MSDELFSVADPVVHASSQIPNVSKSPTFLFGTVAPTVTTELLLCSLCSV